MVILANMKELTEYPDIIVQKIINSKPIIKLLHNKQQVEVPDDSVIYDKVYPYDYIPDVINDESAFVCVDSDIVKVSNNIVKAVDIYIYIFVHYKLMKLPNFFKTKGNRRDKLADEIDMLLNGSRDFGIGKLNLMSARRVRSNARDYTGRLLVYRASDFNQDRSLINE